MRNINNYVKTYFWNFFSTFLGVVVASLVVAFFALIWERSTMITEFKGLLETHATVDKELANEIGRLKAQSEYINNYFKFKEINIPVEVVEDAQEQVQQTLDKAVYRAKELRK